MRLGTLLNGLDAEYHACSPDTEIHGVIVDSRRAAPGLAFLAVAGITHDGHDFITQAAAAGALVLLQRGRVTTPAYPHVRLPDTAAALPTLAARSFGEPADKLRLAGVTGTNGKTTVTYLVAAMLAAAGRKHVRLGTAGNWLVDHAAPAAFTTPFPLELQGLLAEAVARGATELVMEVSSHALAQGRARPLRYHAVGFTSFSQDHLDFHGTMADYFAAKRLLASEYLRADGVAVAAVDGQPAAHEFLAAARETGARAWRASRGGDPRAEICVLEDMSSGPGFDVQLRTPCGEARLRSPLIGGYNLDNALVALGLALGLEVPLERAIAGLETSHGAPGRLERVSLADVPGPTVVVDYAHTPDAVARALDAVRPACAGRLWIVLGCGGDRDPSKRAPMGRLAAAGADVLVATSDNPRSEDPPAIVTQMLADVPPEHRDRVIEIVDRATAIAHAVTSAAPEDLVLIAGKGHEDYQILAHGKIHFDDREHAVNALAARCPPA